MKISFFPVCSIHRCNESIRARKTPVTRDIGVVFVRVGEIPFFLVDMLVRPNSCTLCNCRLLMSAVASLIMKLVTKLATVPTLACSAHRPAAARAHANVPGGHRRV